MPAGLINETACATLALNTRLAWTEDMPQPLPRRVLHRMRNCGAISGLVLRDTPEIEEKWFERAYALLTRVSDVYERMEDYRKAGYMLLLPGDEAWPQSLDKLGEEKPAFLFMKGNLAHLEGRLISVAGSRRILPETQRAAEKTGSIVAQEGAVLVTGGAGGVDAAALNGQLRAGGEAVIVPALSVLRLLEQNSMQSAHRDGRLSFLCDTLPDEPFSAVKALGRNHTIYALGICSLVVAARVGRGGSWRGAVDCIRGGWNSVYVWDGDNADTRGNGELKNLGASSYSINSLLSEQIVAAPEQMNLFDGTRG